MSAAGSGARPHQMRLNGRGRVIFLDLHGVHAAHVTVTVETTPSFLACMHRYDSGRCGTPLHGRRHNLRRPRIDMRQVE
jgi:hypothetical protein